MAIKCPEDHADMEEKSIEVIDTVVLDMCGKCDGIWLDKGELQTLARDDLIELKMWDKGTGMRHCPRCNSVMKKFDLRGVIVDQCVNECGIYFDKGEVEKVLGKKIHVKSKDQKTSLGVTVAQMQELLDRGSICIESVEIRLISAPKSPN